MSKRWIILGIIAALLFLSACAGLDSLPPPSFVRKTTTSSFSDPPRSGAYRCAGNNASTAAIPESSFRSGAGGEDKRLLEYYFDGLCGGTYIELGALDGKFFSNSYVFHGPPLSWKGVLIELGEKNYAKLVRNRQNEIAVVRAAVCEKRRTVHYVENGPVGGIAEFASPEFKARWWKNKNSSVDYRPVECLPMNDLLRERVGVGSFFFDFLSLDVEGAEYEIVRTLDFARYEFGVIVVEANKYNEPTGRNAALKNHIISNGYKFEGAIGKNYWFVNEDFRSIYANLLAAAPSTE